mmetsp:Transcript_74412/g.187495  ORF Transcript_74412/g.187495 Transcript_74412/m.187495 type:complete len:364 (+) Transcript_74412:594-1685(+)
MARSTAAAVAIPTVPGNWRDCCRGAGGWCISSSNVLRTASDMLLRCLLFASAIAPCTSLNFSGASSPSPASLLLPPGEEAAAVASAASTTSPAFSTLSRWRRAVRAATSAASPATDCMARLRLLLSTSTCTAPSTDALLLPAAADECRAPAAANAPAVPCWQFPLPAKVSVIRAIKSSATIPTCGAPSGGVTSPCGVMSADRLAGPGTASSSQCSSLGLSSLIAATATAATAALSRRCPAALVVAVAPPGRQRSAKARPKSRPPVPVPPPRTEIPAAFLFSSATTFPASVAQPSFRSSTVKSSALSLSMGNPASRPSPCNSTSSRPNIRCSKASAMPSSAISTSWSCEAPLLSSSAMCSWSKL